MGVATGCGFKEIYRFPHTTYPYSSCICSFLQQHPYFFVITFYVLKEAHKKVRFISCDGHQLYERGVDLEVEGVHYIDERQKIRHYHARSTKERRRIRRRRRRMPNRDFFTSRGEYVNLRYIAMLYTYWIGNQP